MKGEMGGGIMKEFVVLRPKIYSYLTENGYAHRNAKGTKKCVIKHKIKFEDYKNCLERNETIFNNRSKLLEVKHTMHSKKAEQDCTEWNRRKDSTNTWWSFLIPIRQRCHMAELCAREN